MNNAIGMQTRADNNFERLFNGSVPPTPNTANLFPYVVVKSIKAIVKHILFWQLDLCIYTFVLSYGKKSVYIISIIHKF